MIRKAAFIFCVLACATAAPAATKQLPRNGQCWTDDEATIIADLVISKGRSEWERSPLAMIGGQDPVCPDGSPDMLTVYNAPLCSGRHFADFVASRARVVGYACRLGPIEARRIHSKPTVVDATMLPTPRGARVEAPPAAPKVKAPTVLPRSRYSFVQVRDCLRVANAMAALFYDRPVERSRWKEQADRLNQMMYDAAVAEGLGTEGYLAASKEGRNVSRAYIEKPDTMKEPLLRCGTTNLIQPTK